MRRAIEPNIRKIPVDQLRADAGIQIRAKLNEQIVREYAEAMQSGRQFPPIIAYETKPDEPMVVVDGHHRAAAARKAGLKELLVEVRQGDRIAAIKAALGANSTHGLKRTNKDKAKALQMAIHEFPHLSARQLADLCAVSADMASRQLREQVSENDTSASKKRVGKDGKSYPAIRKPRKRVVAHQSARRTDKKPEAQLPAACPPCPNDGLTESDVGIVCGTPSEQQVVTVFRQLIECAITARQGSIPFFRAKVAAMSAWLKGLPPDTDPKTPAATGTNISALPDRQSPVADSSTVIARTAPGSSVPQHVDT